MLLNWLLSAARKSKTFVFRIHAWTPDMLTEKLSWFSLVPLGIAAIVVYLDSVPICHSGRRMLYSLDTGSVVKICIHIEQENILK
jgi:hypothetical protein